MVSFTEEEELRKGTSGWSKSQVCEVDKLEMPKKHFIVIWVRDVVIKTKMCGSEAELRCEVGIWEQSVY